MKGDAVGNGDSAIQYVERGDGRVQHSGSFVEFFQATPNLRTKNSNFLLSSAEVHRKITLRNIMADRVNLAHPKLYYRADKFDVCLGR